MSVGMARSSFFSLALEDLHFFRAERPGLRRTIFHLELENGETLIQNLEGKIVREVAPSHRRDGKGDLLDLRRRR